MHGQILRDFQLFQLSQYSHPSKITLRLVLHRQLALPGLDQPINCRDHVSCGLADTFSEECCRAGQGGV